MAESAGRYCPHCGQAVGLRDRVCRWCGGSSLRIPAQEDAGAPPTSKSSQEASEGEARERREMGVLLSWWRRLFGG